MTEAEWLACDDPSHVFHRARGLVLGHHRKLRLFAVACCRGILPLLNDPRSWQAIEVAEQHADGLVNDHALTAARNAAAEARQEAFLAKGKVGSTAEWAAQFVAAPDAFGAARSTTWMCRSASFHLLGTMPPVAAWFRDIFGNPFRPVVIKSSCLTADVVALATAMYEQRAFDRTPELAAMLRAAGCTDAAVLDHLALPADHVKGCWAIDLALNRS
jgi:hypothetical protein